MRQIKCMFCGKSTTIHNIVTQKKVNGKLITLKNSPVYYCKDCDETFMSKEVQDVFNYIKDRRLDEKSILYEFEDMIKKVY
jgi:YgiT-type zinc finger domain-containing protein